MTRLHRRRALRAAVVSRFLAAVVALAGLTTWGQTRSARPGAAAQVRLEDLDGRTVRSPEYRVSAADSLSASRRDWFRIRGEYETAPEWADGIGFTAYALFKPDFTKAGVENPTSRFLLLRGEVAHANVRRGNHVVDFYIHPSTLERYGDVERIALVIKHQGREVESLSSPEGREGWWTQLRPLDGQLLDRNSTPFAFVEIDAHEMIPVPAAAASSRR